MQVRRTVALALLLALVGLSAQAASLANQQANTVAVSTTAVPVTFTKAAYVLLINDGPDAVYVRLDGGVATAAAPAFALRMGESLAPPQTLTRLSYICASGQSASVRHLAYEVTP